MAPETTKIELRVSGIAATAASSRFTSVGSAQVAAGPRKSCN